MESHLRKIDHREELAAFVAGDHHVVGVDELGHSISGLLRVKLTGGARIESRMTSSPVSAAECS
ncbi:MAG: hypothetical protein E6I60_16710 [Chloroflexi bacterium]|nr:MAG: hypothetical protein E6I60_16710 [Chloroflexota bacterium]